MQSMLYALLRQDQEYGQYIHPTEERKGSHVYTPFCFGSFTGNKTISNDRKEMTFTGRIGWELRTVDKQLAQALCRVLKAGMTLELFHQLLILEDVEIWDTRIHANQCRIRMITPILAYERTEQRQTVYYEPLSVEFEQLVVNNFRRRYAYFTGDDSAVLQFEPISLGKRDKTVTQFKGTWMTGWKGVYLLRGKAEYLTFLYDCGIGQRTSAGFGLFEVLEK